jgi:hypothetical protein
MSPFEGTQNGRNTTYEHKRTNPSGSHATLKDKRLLQKEAAVLLGYERSANQAVVAEISRNRARKV